MKGLTLLGLCLLFSLPAQAFCVADCEQATTNVMDRSAIGYQSNDHRVGSHNFGNDNTAILGNVNIHIGHEHIEIKGMEGSKDSIIDASVHSNVILGNLQQ